MFRTPLARAVAVLFAVNAAGILIAVTDDLASLGTALTAGSVVSVPLVIMAAYALGALVLPGRAGAGLVALASTVSLAAFAADGDLGHAGLTAAQVAFQVVVGIVTAGVLAVALRTLVNRPHPVV
jgi:hypothetical protein